MRCIQWVWAKEQALPAPTAAPRTTWAQTSPIPLQRERDWKVRGPEGATDRRLPTRPWGTSDAGLGDGAECRQAGASMESKPSPLPAPGRRDGDHLLGPACT